MKKLIILSIFLLSSCTNLSRHEQAELYKLKAQGITIDAPQSEEWEKPANPLAAGTMNILPGFGNFYLAMGNGGQSEHYMYGFLNLLFWPVSVVWAVPEAAIDANNINKRELIYYYKFEKV